MNVRDLYVKKGEPILPAWNRLLEWTKQFRLFAGRGIRFTRTPNGTFVIADQNTLSWDNPFRAQVSDKEAAITLGTINKLVPTLNGVALDASTVPKLKITGGPNTDLRSWICVDVRVDLASGQINTEDKDSVTITHVRELDPRTSEGGSPDDGRGTGRHPLAMLIWSTDKSSIRRTHQITHFNQQHRLIVATDSQPSRHLFWPE